jgi:glycosyltransferase involved in cell wall biosynthesis
VRIGIPLLTYLPGGVGGSEVYVLELVAALARRGAALDVVVNRSATKAFPGLQVTAAARGGRSAVDKLLRLASSTLGGGDARRALRDCDVVHYPLTVPAPAVRAPWLTTLHDVQHHDLPDLFGRAARVYRSLTYDRAARRAAAVVVPSEFVRDRAVTALGLEPERVVTIHHGVAHSRFSPAEDEREPLLLYPARPWPHKNHARLLEAFSLLHRNQPELRLVLTGLGTERFAGIPGVEARGHVSSDELVSLYRRAACLVFPSVYEGFGLPILEAMACGTPVAAARAGALPEVCADAAVLFEPSDPDAIAAGVEEALGHGAELGRLGLARAAGFTWEAAAAAHEDVYELVAVAA